MSEDEEDLGKIIGPVQIGELFYILDTCDLGSGGDRTAKVDCQTYWDENDNYPNLLSVVIPEMVMYDDEEYRVVSIGYAAFAFCNCLASVILPKTLCKIEESAFWGCSSLTSIVIPNGVTVIEKNAFYDCPKLTTIELPDSLIRIGDRAFDDSEHPSDSPTALLKSEIRFSDAPEFRFIIIICSRNYRTRIAENILCRKELQQLRNVHFYTMWMNHFLLSCLSLLPTSGMKLCGAWIH